MNSCGSHSSKRFATSLFAALWLSCALRILGDTWCPEGSDYSIDFPSKPKISEVESPSVKGDIKALEATYSGTQGAYKASFSTSLYGKITKDIAYKCMKESAEELGLSKYVMTYNDDDPDDIVTELSGIRNVAGENGQGSLGSLKIVEFEHYSSTCAFGLVIIEPVGIYPSNDAVNISSSLHKVKR